MKSLLDEDFSMPELPDDFGRLNENSLLFSELETEFRHQFSDMDDSHSFVLVTFYSLFTLCGLLANSLFCLVVLRCKKLHTVTHMLMTNLACCNIVFLLFYPAYLMNTYIFSASDWKFGTFMCKVCLSVIYISSTAPYIYYSEVVVQKQSIKCGCAMEPSRVYFGWMSMTMITIFFQYIIPLLIIVPSYAHIAHFLYSRPPVGVQSREKLLKQMRRRRRLLGTLMAIVALLTAAYNIDTFIYSTIITLLGVTGIPICFLNNDLFRVQLFSLMSCIIPERFRSHKTDRTDAPNHAALLQATEVEMDGDSRMATSLRSSRRGTPVDIALTTN
ncbi:hypothetical protein PFISCL1PPCAC_28209, partial [Pristionchus fissidentatus]